MHLYTISSFHRLLDIITIVDLFEDYFTKHDSYVKDNFNQARMNLCHFIFE